MKHFTQQFMTKFVLTSIKLHPASPNKCDVTKQGGQSSQTFLQTSALQMLGEMLDQFDGGFKKAETMIYNG